MNSAARPAVLDLIGNTPLVEVTRFDTGPCRLFLKLESQNPGGSIKDRIGVAMIEAAERDGLLQPGGTVVEATAGNTGLGLALVARAKGYRVVLVVPDKMSAEKVLHLKALGAEVHGARSDVAKGHPEYYQEQAARIAQAIPGVWFADQFNNPTNPLAHETGTGPELWAQTGHDVDAIVVGVGSAGTLTGLTRFFRKVQPALRFVLADPQGSILAEFVKMRFALKRVAPLPGEPPLIQGLNSGGATPRVVPPVLPPVDPTAQESAMNLHFAPLCRRALVAALVTAAANLAVAADGYVTTNEAKLDAIFSQAGFAVANRIDIRFNRETSIVDATLTTIDNATDWATLTGLAGNLASPTVNMYFVDKILWCGVASQTTIGCAQEPGNVLALDSSWAANATYGGNLAGHELSHNLGLSHLLPDNGANLMNPTISESSALTAGQITTILASALVQSDENGKYITIQPIAVLGVAPVPEPATWAMLLAGAALVAGAARRGRAGRIG